MMTAALPPKYEKVLQQAQAHYVAGDLPEAATVLRKLVKAFPAKPLYLSQLGRILLQTGALDEGVRILERSLRIEPVQPEVCADLGLALSMLGRQAEALEQLDRAIAQAPAEVASYNNRGLVLSRMERCEEALTDYNRALALDPAYIDAHVNQGAALAQLGRFEEAIASYDMAIAVNERLENAWCGRGIAFQQLNRFDEALACFDRALALRPDLAGIWLNRGVVHVDMRAFEAAAEDLERALELKPDYIEALAMLGEALIPLGKYELAHKYLDRAIALTGDAHARWTKAVLLLRLGEYGEGWALYESRWQLNKKGGQSIISDRPLWLGDTDIHGKTILIYPEQGLGDFVHFCRYVPMLVEAGAKVILEAPSPLAPLVASLHCEVTVIRSGDARPAYDFHCPVMSLPRAFRTTLANVPARIPYLFADPAMAATWATRLGPKTGLRVGLVWSGLATQEEDRFRSLPLQQLEPLLSLPAEFHCLQKEVRPADALFAGSYSRLHIHAQDLHSFADTAALIAQMDIVISVCTSVAHVSGALGQEVWLMLNRLPCYRWMLDRDDSPWYPNARLFRQRESGVWTEVVEAICARLRERLQNPPAQSL